MHFNKVTKAPFCYKWRSIYFVQTFKLCNSNNIFHSEVELDQFGETLEKMVACVFSLALLYGAIAFPCTYHVNSGYRSIKHVEGEEEGRKLV